MHSHLFHPQPIVKYRLRTAASSARVVPPWGARPSSPPSSRPSDTAQRMARWAQEDTRPPSGKRESTSYPDTAGDPA